MQPLALLAWYKQLPKELTNGQVRAALTKVMHRMWDKGDNYNEKGFLNIGFCGHQPQVADWYTNNGSEYMASLCFMPLGLPANDAFWTDAAQPWTQVKGLERARLSERSSVEGSDSDTRQVVNFLV